MDEKFVDVETVYEDNMAKKRGRQGWRIIDVFFQQATNAKADNGYPVFVMGRTQADKEQRSADNAAKKAERAKNKGKKTTGKKKSTGRKKSTARKSR